MATRDEESPLLAPPAPVERGGSKMVDKVKQQVQEVANPTKWSMLGMSLFCCAWLALGIGAGVVIEGWSVLTAAYVIVQIITTIGFGDITVTSQRMRFFCTIYVLATICIVASIIMNLLDRFIQSEADMIRSTMRRVEARRLANVENEEQARRIFGKYNALIVSFVPFLLFVSFGTVFYRLYEPCTCSTGPRMVEGCVEGPTCEATGGYMKTWIDALYMSVITMTTVGFGDVTPKSQLGEFLALGWMVFGVAVTAHFVGNVGKMLMDENARQLKLDRVSQDIFRSIDLSRTGTLSPIEFRTYALIKFGLVAQEDLDSIDQLFKSIDLDHDGQLSFAEIQEACD